jgi:hypothetical protein
VIWSPEGEECSHEKAVHMDFTFRGVGNCLVGLGSSYEAEAVHRKGWLTLHITKRSRLEAISQIAGIGLNTLGVIWIGQHWATTRE